MEASVGLVAGSHNRNELVVIRRDGEPGPKPLKQQNRRVCQICGDDVGLTPDGEPFVACNECAFPVCRDCYEYERREGTQNCQCKTRFKRLKGPSLAILSNAPYMLNLDSDHYVNNSKVIKEAMCFMMDPLVGKNVCYVQFPQRFDAIDRHDRYANRNVVFFDINMKGLDGIQGPIYVGTGCVFRRQALYGYDAPKTKKPPSRSCNCWPKWCFCCFCFGNRKKLLL